MHSHSLNLIRVGQLVCQLLASYKAVHVYLEYTSSTAGWLGLLWLRQINNIHTHTHLYLWAIQSKPNPHVFETVGGNLLVVPKGNPHRHRENTRTPHRKAVRFKPGTLLTCIIIMNIIRGNLLLNNSDMLSTLLSAIRK